MTDTDPTPLHATLQRLANLTGLEFSALSFEARLRTQKSVYLLQQMGMPEMQRYGFQHYMHGPYSPRLGTQEFDILPQEDATPATDIEHHLHHALTQPAPFLEAASMAVMVNRVEGITDSRALLKRLTTIKPHTQGVAEDAIQWAQDARLLFPLQETTQ